jgi:uncharacterized protein (TIGR04255 family)
LPPGGGCAAAWAERSGVKRLSTQTLHVCQSKPNPLTPRAAPELISANDHALVTTHAQEANALLQQGGSECVISCEVVTVGEPTFGVEEYDELPLSDPPLEVALCQLKFPVIASILDPIRIAPFQDLLTNEYPSMHQETNTVVAVGPQGPITSEGSPMWRLKDAEGVWNVAIAPDFVALETSTYQSRDNFVDRWRVVIEAFGEIFEPASYERLGVRYVNRLRDDVVPKDEWKALIRDEVYGALAIPMPDEGQISVCISQVLMSIGPTQVQARWGLVPPNITVLPNVEPTPAEGWLLDIDVYSAEVNPFEVDEVIDLTRSHSRHAYNFFRWAVEDDYLAKFGGRV